MKIEISNGELVDKFSILSIKIEKIKSESKSLNVRKEYEMLHDKMLSIGITEKSIEFGDLKKINLTLWDVEDRIRLKELNQEFDDEFIQLARTVYFENDKRAEMKRRINLATGSTLIEEKEYVDYLCE
jgi:hypothetical protein